jgi:hypothetical protein
LLAEQALRFLTKQVLININGHPVLNCADSALWRRFVSFFKPTIASPAMGGYGKETTFFFSPARLAEAGSPRGG